MAITVAGAFADTAAAFEDLPFLIVPTPPTAQTDSYAGVLEKVVSLCERYAAAGYGHGHRVALLLESRPEFFLHYLALNRLGISIVPINPDYRHDEMAYVLDHSEADLAVVLPHRLADVRAAAAASARPAPLVDALDMPAALPRPVTPVRAGEPGLETECALLYTSGTTGRPKGCMLSNLYFLTAGKTYLGLAGLIDIRRGEERFYNPLPLYHINNLAIMATAVILSGNATVLTDRFSPTRWWPEITASGATIIHYLGVVAPMLLNQPPGPQDRAHRVRLGIGAGIEPQLHGAFEERFGFPMVEVWGMTETGRIMGDCHEPRLIDTRAFGRPAPAGLEARVVDGEDRDVPVGSDGELIIRHSAETPRYGFFSGYLKNEAATEEVWRGGWFHTGDVVRQDASGMLFFVDRKKHIIRRAGENIAAAEVEAVLQAHEAVAQVAVLPVADEVREEEVLACVVLMPGFSAGPVLAGALFDHCNARLAYFKAPGWLLFLDHLPTTGTQKVQKTQIFPAGEDPRERAGIRDLRARKKRG
ncbi:MAG TPA: AMP-binding protein [Hyphomicrobiaceae bacterium]|nr:AMP-binding protein [Hyphomicrobiaceae bacterium]